jgi:hypothetical protein
VLTCLKLKVENVFIELKIKVDSIFIAHCYTGESTELISKHISFVDMLKTESK